MLLHFFQEAVSRLYTGDCKKTYFSFLNKFRPLYSSPNMILYLVLQFWPHTSTIHREQPHFICFHFCLSSQSWPSVIYKYDFFLPVLVWVHLCTQHNTEHCPQFIFTLYNDINTFLFLLKIFYFCCWLGS